MDRFDPSGRTSLHWCAQQGHLEVTKLLLLAGANVEPRCHGQRMATPLMLAAGAGHEKVVSALLAAGAGLADRCIDNDRCVHQWKPTALHHAAGSGNEAIVSILLGTGFDRGQHDEAGLTPVEVSA